MVEKHESACSEQRFTLIQPSIECDGLGRRRRRRRGNCALWARHRCLGNSTPHSAEPGRPRPVASTGCRRVPKPMISGLVIMFAGLTVLRTFDLDTSRPVVFATTALIVVGGALVTTPQATIMMSSAPDDLGGSISAVKSAVNEGGYSLGPALFALVGINLFLTDTAHDLSHSGITRTETREALLTAHGGRS